MNIKLLGEQEAHELKFLKGAYKFTSRFNLKLHHSKVDISPPHYLASIPTPSYLVYFLRYFLRNIGFP
jgi:hypothetical protein